MARKWPLCLALLLVAGLLVAVSPARPAGAATTRAVQYEVIKRPGTGASRSDTSTSDPVLTSSGGSAVTVTAALGSGTPTFRFDAPSGATFAPGTYHPVNEQGGLGTAGRIYVADVATCGSTGTLIVHEVTYAPSGDVATWAATGQWTCGDAEYHVVTFYDAAAAYRVRQADVGRDLGTASMGPGWSPMTLYIRNMGPATLTVSQVTMTADADAADFSIEDDTCGVVLDPFQSCQVDMRFDPQQREGLGTRYARITFTDDNAPDGRSIWLSGTPTSGPPASIDIQPPVAAQAGRPMAVNLTVKDESGNLQNSEQFFVRLTSSDPEANMPPDRFSAHAQFTIDPGPTFCDAGNVTLTATIVDTSISDTTEPFPVQPGALYGLELDVPEAVDPFTTFGGTVKAVDLCGNKLSNYTGTVAFDSTDPEGDVPDPVSLNVADQGAKSVNGFMFRNGGEQLVGAFDIDRDDVYGISVVAVNGPYYANRPTMFRDGTWFKRFTYTSGPGDISFGYGSPGDVPVVGDWDGDGVRTPGVFRGGFWYLKNSPASGGHDELVQYGQPGDVPVVGDWDGDGIDTIGVFRNGFWFLTNHNDSMNAEGVFQYGSPGDVPVPGDWDGEGHDTMGVYRAGTWYLANRLDGGIAEGVFVYGNPSGDIPMPGDWDGEGHDTLGVVRDGAWFLSNRLDTGFADVVFLFGSPGDKPLA